MLTAVAKFAYVRDKRLQLMCRGMPCQFDGCGADGPDAGVTWCHSNQARHGKGGAIKASDVFVAAGCWRCHRELDQGLRWGEKEKAARWDRAHARTVRRAVRLGLWPRDVAVPEVAHGD